MGCASSDRKTEKNDNRSKMLLEYLKGIDHVPIREMQNSMNGYSYIKDIPDNLKIGDIFMASDSSQFKLVFEDDKGKNLLCLNCQVPVNENNLIKHLDSTAHVNKL